MNFFSKYIFLKFQLFSMNFNIILDQEFLNDNYIPNPPLVHYHETYELYCVTNGSMIVRADGKNHLFKAGQFTLIPPKKNHFIAEASPDLQHNSIRFVCTSQNTNEFEKSIYRFFENNILVPLHFSQEAQKALNSFKNSFRRFVFDKSDVWNHPLTSADAQKFFSILLKNSISKISVLDNQRISDDDLMPLLIEFFMLITMRDDITMEDLAKSFGYSTTQMARILKNKFGKSFRTLLFESKIQRTKDYLTETDLPIEKISELFGYQDIKYLNTSFKNTVGMTPAAYREAHKKATILNTLSDSTDNTVLQPKNSDNMKE